jgi:hypothetical protein
MTFSTTTLLDAGNDFGSGIPAWEESVGTLCGRESPLRRASLLDEIAEADDRMDDVDFVRSATLRCRFLMRV